MNLLNLLSLAMEGKFACGAHKWIIFRLCDKINSTSLDNWYFLSLTTQNRWLPFITVSFLGLVPLQIVCSVVYYFQVRSLDFFIPSVYVPSTWRRSVKPSFWNYLIPWDSFLEVFLTLWCLSKTSWNLFSFLIFLKCLLKQRNIAVGSWNLFEGFISGL